MASTSNTNANKEPVKLMTLLTSVLNEKNMYYSDVNPEQVENIKKDFKNILDKYKIATENVELPGNNYKLRKYTSVNWFKARLPIIPYIIRETKDREKVNRKLVAETINTIYGPGASKILSYRDMLHILCNIRGLCDTTKGTFGRMYGIIKVNDDHSKEITKEECNIRTYDIIAMILETITLSPVTRPQQIAETRYMSKSLLQVINEFIPLSMQKRFINYDIDDDSRYVPTKNGIKIYIDQLGTRSEFTYFISEQSDMCFILGQLIIRNSDIKSLPIDEYVSFYDKIANVCYAFSDHETYLRDSKLLYNTQLIRHAIHRDMYNINNEITKNPNANNALIKPSDTNRLNYYKELLTYENPSETIKVKYINNKGNLKEYTISTKLNNNLHNILTLLYDNNCLAESAIQSMKKNTFDSILYALYHNYVMKNDNVNTSIIYSAVRHDYELDYVLNLLFNPAYETEKKMLLDNRELNTDGNEYYKAFKNEEIDSGDYRVFMISWISVPINNLRHTISNYKNTVWYNYKLNQNIFKLMYILITDKNIEKLSEEGSRRFWNKLSSFITKECATKESIIRKEFFELRDYHKTILLNDIVVFKSDNTIKRTGLMNIDDIQQRLINIILSNINIKDIDDEHAVWKGLNTILTDYALQSHGCYTQEEKFDSVVKEQYVRPTTSFAEKTFAQASVELGKNRKDRSTDTDKPEEKLIIITKKTKHEGKELNKYVIDDRKPIFNTLYNIATGNLTYKLTKVQELCLLHDIEEYLRSWKSCNNPVYKYRLYLEQSESMNKGCIDINTFLNTYKDYTYIYKSCLGVTYEGNIILTNSTDDDISDSLFLRLKHRDPINMIKSFKSKSIPHRVSLLILHAICAYKLIPTQTRSENEGIIAYFLNDLLNCFTKHLPREIALADYTHLNQESTSYDLLFNSVMTINIPRGCFGNTSDIIQNVKYPNSRFIRTLYRLFTKNTWKFLEKDNNLINFEISVKNLIKTSFTELGGKHDGRKKHCKCVDCIIELSYAGTIDSSDSDDNYSGEEIVEHRESKRQKMME